MYVFCILARDRYWTCGGWWGHPARGCIFDCGHIGAYVKQKKTKILPVLWSV